MNGHAFTLCGAALVARPSGALWWPAARLLAVADLHLGKAERLARRGGPLLPPYETADTLARLAAEVDALAPATVLCLGDSFDDPDAALGLAESAGRDLARLAAGRLWVWIAGNHDPGPPGPGATHRGMWREGPLAFRHIALPEAAGEVSGHYHPKARIGGLMLASSTKIDRKVFTVRGEDVIRGEVCQYGSGLAGSMAKIIAALDAGWLVHVRVMSGEGGGFPSGEHSLMVVGHQGGNVLMASDSDPGGELDVMLRTGFTPLYFDPAVPRLSTAVNDEEFPVLASDTRFQRNHHHRYQVISVAGCV